MKIVLENIEYKGHRIDRFVSTLPGVKEIELIPEDKIISYVKESLDLYVKLLEES